MRWSWNIGRPFGIPVRLHWSLLLLGVIAAMFSQSFVGALVGGVLLFASVVAHELAHALTGRVFGVQTRDILLLPIGGMARMDRIPRKGAHEVLIALAGPAMSLLLAAVFGLLAWMLPAGGVGELLTRSLFWANGMLGLFNLLPAFPLDGGRVLRGALEGRVGQLQATTIAAKVGRVLAVVLGVAGLFVGSPTLPFIALFIWFAGSAELAQVRARHAAEVWDPFDSMPPRAPRHYADGRVEVPDPHNPYLSRVRRPRPDAPRAFVVEYGPYGRRVRVL